MPRQIQYEGSNSNERAIVLVNGIEDSLRYLFMPDEDPFAVTNHFVHDLVRHHAVILRKAVETQSEKGVFYQWRENQARYREAMLDSAKTSVVVGRLSSFPPNIRRMPLVYARQLELLKSLYPDEPEYPR